MATNGGDARERLREIWEARNIVPTDDQTIETQERALAAVGGWLEQGESNPYIGIRAIQVLLLNPEQTDVSKRECWKAMRAVLIPTWKSAGAAPNSLTYAQALLLASWPNQEPHEGWTTLVAIMMSSAWCAMTGRNGRDQVFANWATDLHLAGGAERGIGAHSVLPKVKVRAKIPLSLPSEADLTNIRDSYGNRFDPIVAALKQHQSSLNNLKDAVETLGQDLDEKCDKFDTAIQAVAEQSISDPERAFDLLWWGQARYCRAERKPYRRLPSQDDVLWWAAREAAELSRSLEVEPAASYVVETLTSLGHDTFEKKPLLHWMSDLHNTLGRVRDKTPHISKRLEQIASVDALGLPVTWVRLKAASKDSLEGADAAVALALDTEIDRGEWASWIFRETLLDLRLSEGA